MKRTHDSDCELHDGPAMEPGNCSCGADPGMTPEKYGSEFPAKRESDKPSSVNHPSHYGGDNVYEVIKVLEAWGLDKCAMLFNVVKYVARAGKKDPAKELEDLEKAKWYLQRKIDRLKGMK